jgi:DNA-binding CsgD family transcriptional regulator
MAIASSVSDRPLVGRAGELATVVGLLRGAVGGRAGALLVSGEAGVGKTTLARAACSQVVDFADVVWGSCLPLASLAVPFLPLRSALREWREERGAAAVPLSGGPDWRAGEGPVEFDAWLDGVCRQRPVVLVVDDLHWADQSSLDVLMYVLAGPSDRRLAVVATVRTGEVGEGHPLRRWLADVRRLPGVTELPLGRLDRVGTAEQLAGLLGAPPHQSLVDAVFARAQGNAYLTSLLVRKLSPDATSLPTGLPSDLREAAAQAWHGLSQPARELTGLVAVSGRPQRARQLAEVAQATGPPGDLVPLLREAVDAGVLEVAVDDTYWFAHPLLAEVLEEGLLPEERRARHAAFAVALESRSALGEDLSVERLVDIADHHYSAGHANDAYVWALRGAEAAERAGGAAEMLRLMRRALDLWPEVLDPGASRLDLLRRLWTAAERAGAQEEELAAVEDLLATVDRARQPLLAAELLVRRTDLRLSTGREFAGLDDVREAVRISAPYPGSAEHALAMAELAHAEMWHGEPSGPAHAQDAVRLARACGSAKALTYALTANVMRRVLADEGGGLAEAEEAQAAAAEARDFWAFVHATLWAGNSTDSWASSDVTEIQRRGREELVAMGASHTYVAWLSADEALGLLPLGEWRLCQERLRVVLGSTPGPMGDTMARLTAAVLAVWQGRRVEAEGHLARAEELFAEQSGFLAFPFDAVRAELAVNSGDTARAFSAAMIGVTGEGERPTMVERLIPLAARAAADEAQTFRDRSEDPAPAVAQLRDLQRRYPAIVADQGAVGPSYLAQVRAMQAWYDAELLRGESDPAAAAAWTRAARACADAGLAWDEAYAWWRAGEALLLDRSARDEAAAALRRAHELALDLEALPLRTKVEAVARSARIPLAAAATGAVAEPADSLPGLTPREREVLRYVVAGRTYGEIASELVISEKTVSVHISNLLHKTGTSSRVELAQLVGRLANPASH